MSSSYSDNYIRVVDVVKVYETATGGVTALRGVSMDVGRGEMVAVMGPSGSGKTTLLSIIGGLDTPSAGKVYVDNIPIHKLIPRELDEYRLKYIGFVFQFLNLITRLTAYENIELPMIARGIPKSERRERIIEIAEALGIQDKLDRLPEELSGGEQQRVAIAAAAAGDPPIIIADEPTAELDGETIELVMDFFAGLREGGKTLIIATHDPRVARRADKIVLLEDGLVTGIHRGGEIGVRGEAVKSYRDFLRIRIDEINREISMLGERFKRGEITLEELNRKYNMLVEMRRILENELRFG